MKRSLPNGYRKEIAIDTYLAMPDAPEARGMQVATSFTGRGGIVCADIRPAGVRCDLTREVLINAIFS